MITKTIDGLSVLQSELLLAAGIPHGWFDRSLGNTIFRPTNPFTDPEWIDESAMRRRRSQACQALGLDASKLVITSGLLQTDVTQTIDRNDAGTTVGPADGYITDTPGLPVLLAAGDCSQMIVYAPDKKLLAVVHAGGLGTANHILEKVIARLAATFTADPRHMIVVIGPTIGASHYVPTMTTDHLTLASIASSNPVTKELADGRTGYDIVASNVRQLQHCHVPESQIEVSGIDTFLQPNWYSYERDREHDLPAAMRRHGLFVALP